MGLRQNETCIKYCMGCKGSRVRIPPPRPLESSIKDNLRIGLCVLCPVFRGFLIVARRSVDRDGLRHLNRLDFAFGQSAELVVEKPVRLIHRHRLPVAESLVPGVQP